MPLPLPRVRLVGGGGWLSQLFRLFRLMMALVYRAEPKRRKQNLKDSTGPLTTGRRQEIIAPRSQRTFLFLDPRTSSSG
jgi:hypothetical protein